MRAVPIEEGVVPICPGPGSEPMRSASTRRDHGDVSLFGLHQECRPAPLVSRLLLPRWLQPQKPRVVEAAMPHAAGLGIT
jgi:hypothetical protein